MSIAVHRFEELIGGHPYLIEVAAVANDRWRACIVRIPGGPIALMPFYGPTQAEAARRLRQWLTRAHEPASKGMATAVLASENPREAVCPVAKRSSAVGHDEDSTSRARPAPEPHDGTPRGARSPHTEAGRHPEITGVGDGIRDDRSRKT
jgi:hypothetical protein